MNSPETPKETRKVQRQDGNKIAPTSIRIPDDLKARLSELSKHEHWNTNQTIIEAIKLLLNERGF